MANNKDFILKNSVEVGGPTNVTLGTVTSNNIDLATGNYFADTPTGASTYTISNAGDVQSFQLEVTGGTAEILQNFSTTLYTGNGGTQAITNGIDLAGDGGLVWVKWRSGSATAGNNTNHILVDSETGTSGFLESDTTNARTATAAISSFNSNGFTTGGLIVDVDNSGDSYVSWTFKKEPSFFDVVTYTGNDTSYPTPQTISHNLGSVPGMIIVKNLTAGNWAVYHRGLDATNPENYAIEFTTDPRSSSSVNHWNSTLPTSTEFTVGANYNTNGVERVAYLFAHDDAADGLIRCGSYTGTGAEVEVNLGFKPQWILTRRADDPDDWYIIDTMRGIVTAGDDAYLRANLSSAEGTGVDIFDVTATGFKTKVSSRHTNGGTYIYVAIRAASDLDITWPSSIEWAGGVAPAAPATGETDVYTLSTDDGGTSYVGVKTADNLS